MRQCKSENDESDTQPEIFQCVVCKLHYQTDDELTTHFRNEHMKYSCDKCPQKFFKKTFLTQHKNRAHLESKNLKCPICDQILKTRYNLRQHMYTHTDNRDFECTYPGCLAKFRQINSLNAHKKIHINANRRECPICKKMFTKLGECKCIFDLFKMLIFKFFSQNLISGYIPMKSHSNVSSAIKDLQPKLFWMFTSTLTLIIENLHVTNVMLHLNMLQIYINTKMQRTSLLYTCAIYVNKYFHEKIICLSIVNLCIEISMKILKLSKQSRNFQKKCVENPKK